MSLDDRLDALAARVSAEFAGGLGVDYIRHAFHEQQFKRRRGGSIGTNGLGAVNIRLDHHPDLASGMVALHDQYNIPATWAFYSQQQAIANHSTAWLTLQDWAMKYGMEPWCHSRTHTDATTPAGILAEIETSKAELQANFPRCVIEGFIIPGVGGTGFGGFTSTGNPDDWYGTLAGRLMMRNYAVSSGHMDGIYWPLTGDIVQGKHHLTIEAMNATDTIAVIKKAQDYGMGVCLMAHPNRIGTAGYMSLADYGAVLSYINTERAAGRLMALTLSGLSVADSSHARRTNLIINGDFAQDGFDWSTTGSWTYASYALNGNNVPKTATVTGTNPVLTKILDMTQIPWARGGTYELTMDLYMSSGTAGQVHDINVNVNNGVVSKTYQVLTNSLGPSVKVRLPMVLDATRSLYRIDVTKLSTTGRFYVTNVRFEPV